MTDRVPAKGNVLGTLVPARYILAGLGSVAMAIVYGLKVNLSVAMVAMLNHTRLEEIANSTGNYPKILANDCGVMKKGNGTSDGPFAWEEPLQGVILSCYFWGYFVSQIPGARIAEKFSAKYVMLFSVAINVVCTLLTPLAAKLHYSAVIAMRIGEGIGGGVTFPSMHVMLAAWAPTTERSTMSALVYAGTSLGTVLSMFSAGLLASAYGWESIFYVMGGLSCIWIVLWLWLIQDTPSKQHLISLEERNYINSSLGTNDKHVEPTGPTPWRSIFKSMPFWAILVAHTCSNWGWYTLLIETSFYFKQVLMFDLKDNAVATSLPFLTMWFFSMALSKTLDKLRANGSVSTTFARKLSTLIASVGPMICLLILCYIGCHPNWAVAIMGLGITSIGGMFCGFLANHIDIAPNYAGTLMAITNTVATLPGIIMPIFVGAVTKKDKSIEAWRIIFFVTIALYVIEMVMYTLFGSGEEQPWNKSQARELHTVSSGKGENSPLKGRAESRAD